MSFLEGMFRSSLWRLILDWKVKFELSWKFIFAVQPIAKVDTTDSAISMNLKSISLDKKISSRVSDFT